MTSDFLCDELWSSIRRQIDDMWCENVLELDFTDKDPKKNTFCIAPNKFYRICKLNGICCEIIRLYNSWPRNIAPETFIKDSINSVDHNISLPQVIRYICWLYNYGLVKKHKCIVCRNKTLYFKNLWHAGHIKAKSLGGNNNPFTNLIPICPECNMDMGTQHMAEYVILPKGAIRKRKRDLQADIKMVQVSAYKSFKFNSREELHSHLSSLFIEKGDQGINDLIDTNKLKK